MRLVSTVLMVSGLLIVGACGDKSPATSGAAAATDGGIAGDGNGSDGSGGGGGSPTNVRLTLTHRPTNAAAVGFLVAYRDGAGPWTLAPSPSSDTYTLPINAPVYAVAWTCIAAGANGQLRSVNELQFTVTEMPALTVDIPARCRDQANLVTLQGTIENPGTFTHYVVKFGDLSATVANNDQFTLQTPPGTHDLVVLGEGSINLGSDSVAQSAYVQRDLAVTANTELMLDADAMENTQSFAVTNFGGFSGHLRDTAQTILYANGTTAQLVNDSTSSFETESLAADQMVAGDVYDEQLVVTTTGAQIAMSVATAAPAEQAWVDVPALGAVTSTATAGLVTSSWAEYSHATGYTWLANQQLPANACGGGGACSITWTAQLSAAVLGTMPAYTTPDLSGVTGWNQALQLVAGKPATGGVQAMTSSAMNDFPALVPPPIGAARTFAGTQLTITP